MTEKTYQLAEIDELREEGRASVETGGPSAAAYVLVAVLTSLLTIMIVAPVIGVTTLIMAPFAASLASLVTAIGLALHPSRDGRTQEHAMQALS